MASQLYYCNKTVKYINVLICYLERMLDSNLKTYGADNMKCKKITDVSEEYCLNKIDSSQVIFFLYLGRVVLFYHISCINESFIP